MNLSPLNFQSFQKPASTSKPPSQPMFAGLSGSIRPAVTLPDIHDFGKVKPSDRDLAPLAKCVQERLEEENLPTQKPLTYEQTLQALGFIGAVSCPKVDWVMKNDVDILTPDGRVDRDELNLYAYRLDQAGNRNGVLERDETIQGIILGFKHYILDNARKAGCSDGDLKIIEAKLVTDKFTASAKRTQDSVDLTCSSIDNADASFGRVFHAAHNLECSANFPQSSIAKSRQLQWFVDTGNMPAVQGDDKGFRLVQWLVSQASIRIQNIAGKSFTLGRRTLEMDRNGSCTTGVKPFPVQDSRSFWLSPEEENQLFVQDPDGFRLSREEADHLMAPVAERVIEVLSSAKGQAVLQELYQALPEACSDNDVFQRSLQPLFELLTDHFGIETQLVVKSYSGRDSANATSGGARFSRGKRSWMELYRESLTDPVPVSDEQKARFVQKIVNVVTHELFHDYQNKLKMIPIPSETDWEKRFLDYINVEIPNAHYLTALMGHHDWYRHSPKEHDAYFIGDRAGEYAKKWAEEHGKSRELAQIAN